MFFMKKGMFASAVFVFIIFLSAAASAKQSGAEKFNVPFKYALGKQKFDERCSSCHGLWGMGTKQGPPLMHSFYKPSHHADGAFYRAALKGVRAHHWKFGDMPRVQGIELKELDLIIPFIRWLQRENGIH